MLRLIIYWVIMLAMSVVFFYIGYNGFTRTKEFVSNYGRLLCISPKNSRKHWSKSSVLIEYKVTSFFFMIFSVIVFILLVSSIFQEQVTLSDIKLPTIISKKTLLYGVGHFMFFNGIIAIPIVLYRIEILRKINKSLLFKKRIKNFSFQIVYELKPEKKIDSIKRQYKKYQVLTLIYWLYYIWVITGLTLFVIWYLNI